MDGGRKRKGEGKRGRERVSGRDILYIIYKLLVLILILFYSVLF